MTETEKNSDTKSKIKNHKEIRYEEGFKKESSIVDIDVNRNTKIDFRLKNVIDKYFNELIDFEEADLIAKDILKNGDPLKFIMDISNIYHISDKWLKYVIHCSIICPSIVGSSGIQPHLVGEKGSGKTNLADTFQFLIPDNIIIKGTFSNKGIYYAILDIEKRKGGNVEGLIIYSDDVALSPDFEDIIKRSTSDFHKRTTYYTVIDKKRVALEIPAKTIWWLTSVDTSKSDQLADRFITAGIDESNKTTDFVKKLQFKKASMSKEKFELINEVLICRRIYKNIRDHQHNIGFNDDTLINLLPKDENRRTSPILYDILKSITSTYFMQRDGVPTENDWKLALDIWKHISITNILNLNPKEALIYDMIPYDPKSITQKEIGIKLKEMNNGLSKGRISQIMKGKLTDKGWDMGLVDKLSLNVSISGKEKYYSKSISL